MTTLPKLIRIKYKIKAKAKAVVKEIKDLDHFAYNHLLHELLDSVSDDIQSGYHLKNEKEGGYSNGAVAQWRKTVGGETREETYLKAKKWLEETVIDSPYYIEDIHNAYLPPKAEDVAEIVKGIKEKSSTLHQQTTTSAPYPKELDFLYLLKVDNIRESLPLLDKFNPQDLTQLFNNDEISTLLKFNIFVRLKKAGEAPALNLNSAQNSLPLGARHLEYIPWSDPEVVAAFYSNWGDLFYEEEEEELKYVKKMSKESYSLVAKYTYHPKVIEFLISKKVPFSIEKLQHIMEIPGTLLDKATPDQLEKAIIETKEDYTKNLPALLSKVKLNDAIIKHVVYLKQEDLLPPKAKEIAKELIIKRKAEDFQKKVFVKHWKTDLELATHALELITDSKFLVDWFKNNSEAFKKYESTLVNIMTKDDFALASTRALRVAHKDLKVSTLVDDKSLLEIKLPSSKEALEELFNYAVKTNNTDFLKRHSVAFLRFLLQKKDEKLWELFKQKKIGNDINDEQLSKLFTEFAAEEGSPKSLVIDTLSFPESLEGVELSPESFKEEYRSIIADKMVGIEEAPHWIPYLSQHRVEELENMSVDFLERLPKELLKIYCANQIKNNSLIAYSPKIPKEFLYATSSDGNDNDDWAEAISKDPKIFEKALNYDPDNIIKNISHLAPHLDESLFSDKMKSAVKEGFSSLHEVEDMAQLLYIMPKEIAVELITTDINNLLSAIDGADDREDLYTYVTTKLGITEEQLLTSSKSAPLLKFVKDAKLKAKFFKDHEQELIDLVEKDSSILDIESLSYLDIDVLIDLLGVVPKEVASQWAESILKREEDMHLDLDSVVEVLLKYGKFKDNKDLVQKFLEGMSSEDINYVASEIEKSTNLVMISIRILADGAFETMKKYNKVKHQEWIFKELEPSEARILLNDPAQMQENKLGLYSVLPEDYLTLSDMPHIVKLKDKTLISTFYNKFHTLLTPAQKQELEAMLPALDRASNEVKKIDHPVLSDEKLDLLRLLIPLAKAS